MWLQAVKLELQLRSIVIEIRLQRKSLSLAIMLIMTSDNDCSGKALEAFLIERLPTLSKALEDDQT
jgi:hypothetical protein